MLLATQKMLLYVQGCKEETDPISTVYALGANAAPTRQARACLVEHAISAMDLTCSSGHSAEVDLARRWKMSKGSVVARGLT